MAALGDSVRFLKGVGPEMATRLARLDIHTIRDLLFHVPVSFRDRSEATPIARLTPGSEASILASVVELRAVRKFRGKGDLRGTLRDETGFLRVVWFNQSYRADALVVGERYLFSGAVQAFRGLELHNPEFEPAGSAESHLHVGRIVPRYPLTEGIADRWLRSRIRAALDQLPPTPDVVPAEERSRLGLPDLRKALEEAHFPPRMEAADPARRRIALEELLTLQVSLQYARREHRSRGTAPSLREGESAMRRFLSSLPFQPTEGQARALDAIAEDLDRTAPMCRLLLGDVGSGKTVVALAAAVRAAAAGHQAAILAPTSILAEQHAATAERLLEPVGVSHAVLTAATPPKARDRILAGLESGEISLVIGTHALIERDLVFRSLAVVMVDEQHRFGVRQRFLLTRHGPAERAHLLVLSATPIPRSLALTVYGDLDLSLLPEKPPGRSPVETRALDGDRPGALVDLLCDEVAQGGSAFVIYPIVEESEKLDLKAATEMAAALGSEPALAGAGVALVHGALRSEERRTALARFRSGEARVLVATTVVEVGLDIPDATLVVIEHPERFGLAQLHQLRGRVGRAERAGRCVIVLGASMGQAARKRLGVFLQVNDGFRLAEEDLKLRGPGQLLGQSQHGFLRFKAADPLRDPDLLEAARAIGAKLLDEARVEEGKEDVRGWIEEHFAGAERWLASG